ncbi:hypothetical protein roselon_00368 [Roseibacterium elongatum DSM 19469]|uniref:Uncharacterized protein n=1 Tax=Roseicyclus elongatus DSM 19469 TaxID=1294273 RepID=W8RP61_9RHOB|nr:hypothetical protein roselon_00368 [Roseibacterium elongatum DSM 19469]
MSELSAAPPATAHDLPAALRRFAERNGGDPDGPHRTATLLQDVTFRQAQDAAWGPMEGRHHMAIGQPGFVWEGRSPGVVLPRVVVIDAFVAGAGQLRVFLLGAIPVAHAQGPVIDRAEAMRYLAEIVWSPDAILRNPAIQWTQTAPDAVEAALDLPSGRAVVTLLFDDAGDIVEMQAERPDAGPDGVERLRSWRGYFRNYDWIGDRRIPLDGEVGYVDDGVYWAYWRGRITDYRLHD